MAMTQNPEQRSSIAPAGPIRCLVIESEESIRWGLSFLLQNSGIWQIIGECDRLELGLARLEALSSTPQPVQLLLLGLGDQTPDRLAPILQSIRAVMPALPIVVLGQIPASIKMVERLGISGYWWKGDRPEVLLEILSNLPLTQHTDPAAGTQFGKMQPGKTPSGKTQPAQPTHRVVSPNLAALARLAQASQGTSTWLSVDPRFAIFDRTLAELNWQLRSQSLSWIDRSVIQGRIRELQTARWIAQQLLPKQPKRRTNPSGSSTEADRALAQTRNADSASLDRSPITSRQPIDPSLSQSLGQSLSQSLGQPLAPDDRITLLFDQFTIKLAALHKPQDGTPSKLENQTHSPLELDILTPDRRHQLLSLTAQVLQAEIQQLQGQQIRLSQLYDRKILFLETLWETITTQFFLAPNLTAPNLIAPNPQGRAQSFNLTPTLLRSRSIVSDAILQHIPLTGEWLAYLLFQTPLTLDNRPYTAGSPEAENRALIILENTTIQLANAVLQPLINQFSNVESVKGQFFNPRYTSNRKMTKFRNDLSWRYRRDRWFDHPTDMFESQYRLFYLTLCGIQSTSIYAPRSAELQALEGFPLAVTLALETRDAISPRLRSALSFIGSGVVYVLTEVVGRGIGLIGRGIAKGIGNAWQERR